MKVLSRRVSRHAFSSGALGQEVGGRGVGEGVG